MSWYTATSDSAVRLYLLPPNFVLRHSLTIYLLRKRPRWSKAAWIEHIEDIRWKRCFRPDFRQFTYTNNLLWSLVFTLSQVLELKDSNKDEVLVWFGFFSSAAFNSRQKGYHFIVCILPLSRSKRCINVLLCLSPLTGSGKEKKIRLWTSSVSFQYLSCIFQKYPPIIFFKSYRETSLHTSSFSTALGVLFQYSGSWDK